MKTLHFKCCSELNSETYDRSQDYVAIILKTSVFGGNEGGQGGQSRGLGGPILTLHQNSPF